MFNLIDHKGRRMWCGQGPNGYCGKPQVRSCYYHDAVDEIRSHQEGYVLLVSLDLPTPQEFLAKLGDCVFCGKFPEHDQAWWCPEHRLKKEMVEAQISKFICWRKMNGTLRL